jgi:hypothetical protein
MAKAKTPARVARRPGRFLRYRPDMELGSSLGWLLAAVPVGLLLPALVAWAVLAIRRRRAGRGGSLFAGIDYRWLVLAPLVFVLAAIGAGIWIGIGAQLGVVQPVRDNFLNYGRYPLTQEMAAVVILGTPVAVGVPLVAWALRRLEGGARVLGVVAAVVAGAVAYPLSVIVVFSVFGSVFPG